MDSAVGASSGEFVELAFAQFFGFLGSGFALSFGFLVTAFLTL